MTISRIGGSIRDDSRGSDVFSQICKRGIIISNIINISDISNDSMMKRCNKRGDIHGITYKSSTKRIKNRDDMIHNIRGVFLHIILLSILP